jgi:membrane protein
MDVPALASQVAYSFMFAIPSLVLLLMSLAVLVDEGLGIPVADFLRDAIEEQVPASAQDLFTAVVDETMARVGTGGASLGLVIAIVVGIWGGSGGVGALVKSCNRAYGLRDTRNFAVKRLLAIWLTGVVGLLVVAGATLFARVYNALYWPGAVLAILIALVTLYCLGTISQPPVRWTLPGAALATASWLLLLWGFRFALNYINPGTPFGAAGGVIVVLLFLYFTGIVFILGAAANGMLIRWRRPGLLPPPVPMWGAEPPVAE